MVEIVEILFPWGFGLLNRDSIPFVRLSHERLKSGQVAMNGEGSYNGWPKMRHRCLLLPICFPLLLFIS